MKKRILMLMLAVLLLLPLLPEEAKAAELPMPRMDNIVNFYDNDAFVLGVLNEYGEVWLYYTNYTYNADGSRVFTHDAAGAICVTTGAKAISAVHYGLFVLGEDGTLRCWRIWNHKATLQETVLTGIKDIGDYGVYRVLALDKQGGLYFVDTNGSAAQIDITVSQTDSDVTSVLSNGNYIKGNMVLSHSYTAPYYEEVISGLPNGVVEYWEDNGTAYVLTEDGDLWGWGRNHVGQLACGEYDMIGPYSYVGSYTAGYSAVLLRCDHPVKIIGGVEQIWINKCQVFVRMKDGTYRTWGDGEPIMAMVDATSGSLKIGDWDYPAGWPNIEGWTIRKTTVGQWEGLVNYCNALFKADGTLWIDFDSNNDSDPYIYVGVWSSNTPKPIYSDVPVGYYCDEPVRWAVKQGVTNGTSITAFSPNQTCTQAQILTFLWRAAGEPGAAIDNPYSHIAMTSNQYFYTAMLWAWEEGLIEDAALDPNAPCKRSDVVSYLWKLDGSPKTTAGSTFTDVAKTADYAPAVQWAISNAITNGTSATTFGPAETCTRGQIVTFLYRYFVE